MRFRKGINVNRVVTKVSLVLIGLYVGGTILTELGNVLNCTASPFYQGLSLIGWTISSATWAADTCSNLPNVSTAGIITSTTAGTGLLSVVGIVAIASVVLEFVQFKM